MKPEIGMRVGYDGIQGPYFGKIVMINKSTFTLQLDNGRLGKFPHYRIAPEKNFNLKTQTWRPVSWKL